MDPQKEGRRIAAVYLDRLGWAREEARVIEGELYAAFDAEKREERLRQTEQRQEDAEAFLSREFDRWRKDPSPEAKEVLIAILGVLGKRHDLGFIGTRVVGHIKRMLGPL